MLRDRGFICQHRIHIGPAFLGPTVQSHHCRQWLLLRWGYCVTVSYTKAMLIPIGLVGGLLGGIIGAWLCNISTDALTKLNKGTYEPEFRIPVQIVAVLLFGIGYFVFMWDLEHPRPNGYYLAAFCHGCICAGTTVTQTSSSLYILYDSHHAPTDPAS